MKFGGGCLRDGRSFARACAIIAGEKRVAVVVSAVSGVTELLLAAIEQARRGEKHIPADPGAAGRNTHGHHCRHAPGRRPERRLQKVDHVPVGPRCGGC